MKSLSKPQHRGTDDDPTEMQMRALLPDPHERPIPTTDHTVILGSYAARDLSSGTSDFTVDIPQIKNVRSIRLGLVRTPATRRVVRENDSIAWERPVKVSGEMRVVIDADDKDSAAIVLPGTLQEVEVNDSTLSLLGTAVAVTDISTASGNAQITTSAPHYMAVGDSVKINSDNYTTANVTAVSSTTVFTTDATFDTGSTSGDTVQLRLIPHEISEGRSILVAGGIDASTPATLTATSTTTFTSSAPLTTSAAPRAYLYSTPRTCDEFAAYIMSTANAELATLESQTRARISRQSPTMEGYVGAFSMLAEHTVTGMTTSPSVDITFSGHGAASVATVFPQMWSLRSTPKLYRPLAVICRLPAGRPDATQLADWITGSTGFIKEAATSDADLHVCTSEGLHVAVNMAVGQYPTPMLAVALQTQINAALDAAKGSTASPTVVVTFSATTGKFTFTASDNSLLTIIVSSTLLQAALGMREVRACAASIVSDFALPFRNLSLQAYSHVLAIVNARERKLYVKLPLQPSVIVDRSTGAGTINNNGTSTAVVSGFVPGDVVRVTVGSTKFICVVVTSGTALTVAGIGTGAPSVGEQATLIVSQYEQSAIAFNCAPQSRATGSTGGVNVVSIGDSDAYLMPSIVGLPQVLVPAFTEGFLPSVYQLTPCGEIAVQLFLAGDVDVSGSHMVIGETNRVRHTFGVVAPPDPETGLAVFTNSNAVKLRSKATVNSLRMRFVDTQTLRLIDFGGGVVTVSVVLSTRAG